MTLDEYKAELDRHDWFYYFSDDHRVWSAGEVASKKMHALAVNGNDDFKRAYNEAYAIRFNTPSFVTKDHPYTHPFPEVS